jgi:hypothetical protein
MKLKLAPLPLVSIVALSSLNAWLLNLIIFEIAPTSLVPPALPSQSGKYAVKTVNSITQKPIGAYNKTLAQPVFFKSRAPYVPPPLPAPVVQSPPPPISNPGFSVAGVIINDRLKKAYLLKQSEPQGSWVAEGENIFGWTVQSVRSTGVTLKQSNQTIDLQLYLQQ